MTIFYFVYWHDRRFKNKAGGPMKVYELSDNLNKRGHQVYLFIPALGAPERQTSANVKAIPIIDLPILRFLSYQLLSIMKAIAVIITEGKPTVFLVRIMWSFLPHLLGKLVSIPIILEINDNPYRGYEHIGQSLKRSIIKGIDRITFKMSDHILPVTSQIGNDLNYKEKISWERMTILPSGTNTDLFKPMNREVCLEHLKLEIQPLYIGFIGTFFRYQGIDVLIESAPVIIDEIENIRFLIVGDGPMGADLREKVTAMGLSRWFIFAGQVAYTDVPGYCNAMDVCVAPFTHEAGDCSPVKVFDYLACGKPVVMSNVANSVEIFKPSGAMIVVPPEDKTKLADAIIRLLRDQQLRKKMGDKARAFIVSDFSRWNLSETVENLIAQLNDKS